MTMTLSSSIPISEVMWKSKKLGEHTREELLEVIYHLLAENHELKSPENIRARSLGRVEMLKRGEVRPSDRD